MKRADKSRWTANSRTYITGYDAQGNTHYSLSVGGLMNYHDAVSDRFHEIDLTPVPSDDPAYEWMIDKAPYKAYLKKNGDRRVYPDRNDLTKHVDLGIPSFMGTDGSMNGNRWEWSKPGMDVEIEFQGAKITFDAILAHDPGFDYLEFPLGKIGMDQDEVMALFGSLILYEQNNTENSKPLTVEFPQGNKVRITWDPIGMNYPLVIDPTIQVPTATSADDGVHDFSHGITTTGFISVGNVSGLYDLWTSFNLLIPQGSTINTCSIDFTSAVNRSFSAGSTKIKVSEVDDGTSIVTDGDWHGISWSTEEATWNLPTSILSGVVYTTEDFANVLQVVVDRPGWVSGNSATFGLIENDMPSSSNKHMFWSFDLGDPAKAPTLNVDFSVPGIVTGSNGNNGAHRANHTIFNNSNVLYLGYTSEIWDAWTTFPNLPIPRGSTILSARIDLHDKVVQDNGGFDVTIKASAVDNAVAPADDTDWHNITYTDASATWNVPAAQVTDQYLATDDFSNVVQEIVDRPGWHYNNGIHLSFLENTGTTNQIKYYWAYFNGDNLAPRLVVTYSSESTVTEVSIAAGGDDGYHWYSNHSITANGTNLNIGAVSGHQFNSFLIFSLSVPKNVIVSTATLGFVSQGTTGVTFSTDIQAEASDDASPPTDDSAFHALTYGAQSVTWANVIPWVTENTYFTSDISTLIQEIVDRVGWVSGNNIQLVFVNSTATGTNRRLPYAYESDPAKAAELTVVWAPPAVFNPATAFDVFTNTLNALIHNTIKPDGQFDAYTITLSALIHNTIKPNGSLDAVTVTLPTFLKNKLSAPRPVFKTNFQLSAPQVTSVTITKSSL